MFNPHTTLTLALTLLFFSIAFNLSVASFGVGSTASFLVPVWGSIVYSITAFFGALLTWPFNVFLNVGRKTTVFVAISFSTLACILEIASIEAALGAFIAGRFIQGFAAGISTTVALLWQTEVSPPESRGRRVAVLLIGNSAGFAIGAWIVYAFSFVDTEGSQRIPLGLQFVVLAATAIAVFFTHDSWRWSLSKGQTDRARALFTIFHPHLPASLIETRFEAIHLHTRQAATMKGLKSCSGRSPPSKVSLHPYRRLFLGTALQLASSLSGVQVATLYLYNAVTGLSSDDGKSFRSFEIL